jgi:hypothetical protein
LLGSGEDKNGTAEVKNLNRGFRICELENCLLFHNPSIP